MKPNISSVGGDSDSYISSVGGECLNGIHTVDSWIPIPDSYTISILIAHITNTLSSPLIRDLGVSLKLIMDDHYLDMVLDIWILCIVKNC